jgi:hypothetical protein
MTDDDPNEGYEVVPIEAGPNGPPTVGGRTQNMSHSLAAAPAVTQGAPLVRFGPVRLSLAASAEIES